MKNLIFILIALSFLSCSNLTNEKFEELSNKPESEYFKKYELFCDKEYILTLTTTDTSNSYNKNKPTVLLNLLKKNGNKIDTIIHDSLFSRNAMAADPEIQFEFIDYNLDGTKDIVIPAGTDPRGNYGFHLYIVDNKSKTIHYVKKFSEIGNPKLDPTNYLIYSFVLSGPAYCKFYQIDKKNGLINLEHYIEFHDLDNNVDSLINREIEKIKQEKLRTTANHGSQPVSGHLEK
jgi:hypothetical protein